MATKQYSVINLGKLKAFFQEIIERFPSRGPIRAMAKNLNLNLKDANLQQIMDFAAFVEKRGGNFTRKGSQQQNQYYWAFGQQKLFCIILPYYFCKFGLNPSQFIANQLIHLQSIFITKTTFQMLFQIKYIESLNTTSKLQWTEQHVLDLKNIVNQSTDDQEDNMKWKNIAVKLFIQNQGLSFHSPRDCRQLWTNHLNPRVSKNSWELKEDYELFTCIKEYGCKWSFISKKMKSMRTQHMVKNRANSIAKKYRFKTKRLNERQVDQILNDLSKQLFEGEIQKQISSEFDQREEVSDYQVEVKSEVKRQEYMSQIYEVLDLSQERIVIAERQMDDDWQYNEEEPISYHYYATGDKIKYDESLQPEPNFPVSLFCFEM